MSFKDSSVNIVLVTSALYDLNYFTERVFFSDRVTDRYQYSTWKNEGDPAYSYRGKMIEIDRELYEKEYGMKSDKSKSSSRFMSLFKFSKNKVEVPIMIISASGLTFKNDHFFNYTVKKLEEADILVMMYDRTETGIAGLHKLIDVFCRYLKNLENEGIERKEKQPCLLIELIKPDSDYKDLETKDISIADQIEGFGSLLLNNSSLYYISLEASSIPPDIYSVIKSLILEVV